MPSDLPSSFASAAAGQNATRGGRGDGRGSAGGEWSRRDGRSTNGTLTFRRSSTTPVGQSSQQVSPAEPSTQPQIPEEAPSYAEVPPARYSRDELLDMYRSSHQGDVSRLFVEGWNPNMVNGHGSRAWGKSNENYIPQEPGACWEPNGDIAPVGLQEMSLEEKEAFSADINSPLKPPTQNKEAHQGAVNGRKTSVSHVPGTNFSVNSPSSATRPGTRRRETVESNPFSASLNSPTSSGRFNRDEPTQPSWPPRKTNESKQASEEQENTDQGSRDFSKHPFGSLMRSHTTGSPITSSAPWLPGTQATTTGSGGFGAFAMPPGGIGDSRPGAASGGSRLTRLMPKEGGETKTTETQNPVGQSPWRSRPRTDTDPFGDDGLSGSAVLGGAQETTSTQPRGRDPGALGTPVKGSTGDFGMSGLNLEQGGDGPISPSETNPYRSPPGDRTGQEENESVEKSAQPPDHPNLNLLGRGFGGAGFEGSDRSQTSSVGAKGFPLPGLSGGWPAQGPAIGTPDRERPNYAAFGGSLFNPVGGDLQSPGIGNLNSVFGPASAGAIGAGSIGRGSKLSSLLPAAMQNQAPGGAQENNLSDSIPDVRQANRLGAIGRNNFAAPSRDTESPMRSSRGIFEEMFPSSESSRGPRGFAPGEPGTPGSFTPVGGNMPFSASHEAHPNQVRQMVMPDRMRWVYLDPQGQVQGPFTGLEMNDWYKANFFTPDLRVKKVEDPDFEPLGQLIRRIGNSREPFLVPQIGVAHGPASQAGPFTPTAQPNGVVPPLSGIFPSFGRTLTADEQNNLERRKQEEQFLMAQQRDFMMRQQVMSKYGVGPGLQHQSSAQSLQSQPSFGSMNSPMPGQQSQQLPIGPAPPSSNFFDNPPGSQATGRTDSGNGEYFRETDLANMTQSERQMYENLSGIEDHTTQQRIGAPGDGLHPMLPDIEQLSEDPEGFRERLREFEELRAQHEAEQASAAEKAQNDQPSSTVAPPPGSELQSAPAKAAKSKKAKRDEEHLLSLTQQVQKTQAAAAAAVQPQEPDMPRPFPPPASTTPLPAPTAQRVRSNLPEQYSRSQTQTPDEGSASQPPPLAPWAKEPGNESSKGPSLKEIQEAEARKAAKAEEAAAALRKAAIEQEVALLKEREKATSAAAAGLPASSTWGHGSPVSAASPWTKPTAVAVPAPGLSNASAASKKTLAEIQREEELRKRKEQQAAVQQGAPVSSTSKSYANLVGKTGQAMPGASFPGPAAAPVGSGWATVGAGGKIKAPTGPAAQNRSVSAAAAKPAAPTVLKPMSRPGPASINKSDTNVAMEEFSKWVGRELSRGITGVSDIAIFQTSLDVLPLDTGIIADAIYANSTTMDGRHFAEEYVRRKKLAERGVVEKQPSDTSRTSQGNSNSGGGWSEVAKKGSTPSAVKGDLGGSPAGDAAMPAGFKVVPSRKKGKK